MRHTGERGVTLIEIMVVVVIVGILAAVAINYFADAPKKARKSEVHAVFAEITTRQLQYHNEFNMFMSTGDETMLHPGPPTASPRSIDPRPAEWDALRLDTKTNLYCAYVTVAGPGGDGSNVGADATAFGYATPARDWFYILAECDFDGNSAVNAKFFTHSMSELVQEQNADK